MNPISPPARPHIAVHSSHFTSASSLDWDDAWDSGSDSEDRQANALANSVKPPAGGTAPKQVPRSNSASSSSTLGFSYTHLNPPNPGSYPQPKTIEEAARSKPQNGWTIIRTSSDHQTSVDGGRKQSQDGHIPDADVEGVLILGELDTEIENADQAPVSTPTNHLSAQSKQMATLVREDAEEIVNGSYILAVSL